MKSEDQEPREDLPILLTSREVAVALKVSKIDSVSLAADGSGSAGDVAEPDVSPVSTQ
jgi:hypothetical protein